ncbi:putative bifunctional diguanylate cyclase/phosphodiesterase [Sphingomonas sp. GlSt437]
MAVLYGLLFAASLLVVAGSAEVMILRHAAEAARDELSASGSVFERIWTFRRDALTNSAEVLARDFGFRSAVMSGDAPTIDSAVETLRARAKVDNAFVIDQAGQVIGSGANDLRPVVAKLPFTLPDNARSAVVTAPSGVYRVVLSPIMAPTEIGWVVFAIRLDDDEMRALQRLSAVPLHAAIVRRTAKGWSIAAGTAPVDNAALTRFLSGPHDGIATLGSFGGEALALAHPLAGDGNQARAILLLSYPLATALAPYRLLQLGLISAGLLGLLLVVWGSRRLANAIARPVAALDAAAKALEEGTRTEVAIQGKDELARLAESFNTMSAGIVERENRITHLAFHDGLTALPNRVLFREQLEATIGRAAKRGGQVSVLCLDLDGFKGVNDTLGHPVGDALLRQIGAELAMLAHDGIVARLGGDEFAIILDETAASDRARKLAQAIVDQMREPKHVGGHQIATGSSVGIAIGPDDGDDADTLLKNADLALYRAKQDGRGVFRFFEPSLDAAARKRRQMELDLREALRLGQFRLNYQPIYDLKNNRIGGFEALLRWQHPVRGAIAPVDFIPVAEETGLIIAMGEWALHEACRQANQWPEHVRVAVNVSPLQFRNSGFASIVFQALGRSGLAPNRLEIEITESVFLDGAESTIGLLHKLRELGIRIALDDFGTGYSSLSYLRSFPFDKIKIDRSFVTDLVGDSSAKAIVKAIVDLATALKMETTAEGVEEDAVWDALRQEGCTSIQGYLFSRPLEAGDTASLLTGDLRKAG